MILLNCLTKVAKIEFTRALRMLWKPQISKWCTQGDGKGVKLHPGLIIWGKARRKLTEGDLLADS